MIRPGLHVRVAAPNLPAPLHGVVSELLPALDVDAIEPHTALESHQLLHQLGADLVARITHRITGHEYGFAIIHQAGAADNVWLTVAGTPIVISEEQAA